MTLGTSADLTTQRSGRPSGPGTAAAMTPPAAPPAPPSPDELLAQVQHPALLAGAAHVLSLWTNERGDALDLDEARSALAWLALAVDASRRGHEPSRDNPASTALGRHFLQLLRAEMVAEWTARPPAEPREILAFLQAFEAVRLAIEPDWSQYFTSRLSGPDGLDLVVEVAHDLRSPVTSIIFLAETLSRGQSGDVTELQKRQLRLIYSAALGLSSMASDVIELARGGDQLVERELSPFSIAEILESVTDMVRPIAEEKGLALRFTPPPSDYRTGRPLALSRVLLNLTTNALKFTDDGFVEITTRAKGQSKLEFSVRDTGHGVSAEALANLYQPFRRTRARAGRSGYYFSGTGLGLAMCRKLVEAMGSELKLETKGGWGTRFYFDLDLPPAGQM